METSNRKQEVLNGFTTTLGRKNNKNSKIAKLKII
jgi:hypothetical protein